MGTPLGLAFGSILPPLIVPKNECQHIPTLNWLLCIPCAIALILVATLRTSKPPTPPSSSAAVISQRPFLRGVYHLLSEKAFVILLIYVGSVFGLFLALVATAEELFTTINANFNDYTCGFFACVLIGGGLLGALLAGIIADITKKYIPLMKVSVAVAAVLIIVLFTVINLQHVDKNVVAVLCGVAGFFAYMTYPMGLDLGIECAFPVASEATCNGLIIISGHLQGGIFLWLILGLLDVKEVDGQRLPCKFEKCYIIMSLICVF